MKSKILFLALITLNIFSAGCAHYHQIYKNSNPEGLLVAIGHNEVQVGDTVDVFKRTCIQNRTRTSSGMIESCMSTKVAETQVLKVLSAKEALINPPAGITLESGMYVEKSRK